MEHVAFVTCLSVQSCTRSSSRALRVDELQRWSPNYVLMWMICMPFQRTTGLKELRLPIICLSGIQTNSTALRWTRQILKHREAQKVATLHTHTLSFDPDFRKLLLLRRPYTLNAGSMCTHFSTVCTLYYARLVHAAATLVASLPSITLCRFCKH